MSNAIFLLVHGGHHGERVWEPSQKEMASNDTSLTGTVAEQTAARADRVHRISGNHAPFRPNPAEFADVPAEIDALVHPAR